MTSQNGTRFLLWAKCGPRPQTLGCCSAKKAFETSRLLSPPAWGPEPLGFGHACVGGTSTSRAGGQGQHFRDNVMAASSSKEHCKLVRSKVWDAPLVAWKLPVLCQRGNTCTGACMRSSIIAVGVCVATHFRLPENCQSCGGVQPLDFGE